MQAIIKFAVLAAVLYFGYTQLLPKLTATGDRVGSNLSDMGESGDDCVGAADRASETFGSGMRSFSTPPIDEGSWDSFANGVYDQISAAQDACSCSLDSCRLAGDALSTLSGVVGDFGSAVRGGEPPLNAARTLDQVNTQLNEARSLIRQGN